MRIEHLFSKLESKTSLIFGKIITAITEGQDHVDILEKDVHILFKFMNLSLRRSAEYRDELKSPYRENDFLLQALFEAERKSGRSVDPEQFWLQKLLYLLETSHDDLVAAAEDKVESAAADTYKHFVEHYSLQIWKAAHGYEFFLNDRLVDFEGDTQSVLGAEVKDTGAQLTWMTSEDLIHLILPISPEVAVIFCDGSRCWESPLDDSMLRLKRPCPQNSLLKNAPHKNITNIDVPRQRRGKKKWPATTAWRVNIGILSPDHHRIIASYSLDHAQSFVVVQRRARFEKAKRELQVFNKQRTEVWKSQGVRFGHAGTTRHHKEDDELLSPSQDQITRIVGDHMSALEEVSDIIESTQGPLQRTKDNVFKSWLVIRACESYNRNYGATPSPRSNTESSHFRIMHPALKTAFEAAYPSQPPDHRDLATINFAQFICYGIGEELFAELTSKIDSRISELVRADSFHSHWEASATERRPPEGSLLQGDENLNEQSTNLEKDLLESASFRSVFRAAHVFDVLKWMFEERQDILATFIQQMAGSHGGDATQLRSDTREARGT